MKTIKLTDKSTNEQCSPIVSDTTIQCQKKNTTLDKIINTSDYFVDRYTFDDEKSMKQRDINEIKEQLKYCLHNTKTDDTIECANGSLLIKPGSFYFKNNGSPVELTEFLRELYNNLYNASTN